MSWLGIGICAFLVLLAWSWWRDVMNGLQAITRAEAEATKQRDEILLVLGHMHHRLDELEAAVRERS